MGVRKRMIAALIYKEHGGMLPARAVGALAGLMLIACP
jgi:hypothetical protein